MTATSVPSYLRFRKRSLLIWSLLKPCTLLVPHMHMQQPGTAASGCFKASPALPVWPLLSSAAGQAWRPGLSAPSCPTSGRLAPADQTPIMFACMHGMTLSQDRPHSGAEPALSQAAFQENALAGAKPPVAIGSAFTVVMHLWAVAAEPNAINDPKKDLWSLSGTALKATSASRGPDLLHMAPAGRLNTMACLIKPGVERAGRASRQPAGSRAHEQPGSMKTRHACGVS